MLRFQDGFLYSSEYAREFLKNKHIVIIGDSVQRYVYKDLISLLQEDRILSAREIQKKFEPSFNNDKLLWRTEINMGIGCHEFREYQSRDGFHLVQYHFVTRCYEKYTEQKIFKEFQGEPPDIVIMNSCLWDVTRYGKPDDCLAQYEKNMVKLCTRMKTLLPSGSQFIWCSALPTASEMRARGMVLEEMNFQQQTLRVQILEANYNICQIVARMGFDVLDLHFYLRPMMSEHRQEDGVHWDGIAHRHITDLILSFLHDAWGVPLPQEAVDKLFKTDRQLNAMAHLKFDKKPKFVKSVMKGLDKLAGIVAPKKGPSMPPEYQDRSGGNSNMEESPPGSNGSGESSVVSEPCPVDFGAPVPCTSIEKQKERAAEVAGSGELSSSGMSSSEESSSYDGSSESAISDSEEVIVLSGDSPPGGGARLAGPSGQQVQMMEVG